MNKKENENYLNNDIKDILDENFFNSFSPSNKITGKKKKINELITNLKQNKVYLSSLLSINNRKKLSKLYELILLNLTENNNNFVLSQLELIELLGQYLYDQNEFKSFYRQALPKLFDKFYLQNQKINDNIINMFNSSIENRILNIEDYYPHIENISLEEDDDYKVIVLNFFYNQMLINDNIIFEKIPKNIINIIENLTQENNADIKEISSKLMNVFENYTNNNNKDVINKKDNNFIDNEDVDIINNDDINNNINCNNNDNFNNNDKSNNSIKISKDNENENNLNEISNSSIHETNINYEDFYNNEDINIEKKNNNINSEEIKEENNYHNYKDENINNNNNNEKIKELNHSNILEDNTIKNNNLDDKIKGEEEKISNELKIEIQKEDLLQNNSPKKKQITNNKKRNHINRINRSRKLGVISKNKKENEEKNNNDINNNIDNNQEIKKIINENLEKNFSDNIQEKENLINNDGLKEKYINNFDDLPIKGLMNNNNENLNQEKEIKKEKNIINIDDLPIKGIESYNNEGKNKVEPNKNEKVINIDDLPIKNINNNNDKDINIKDKDNNINMKEEEENNKYKKENMIIEIDKNIFSDNTKKNKKNRINRKFLNNGSKNIKKDPFENFEILVKEPPQKEQPIQDLNNNNFNENNNNCKNCDITESTKINNKESDINEEKGEKEIEKEKEKKIESNEEKFQSLKLILGEEIVENISSNKWEEKKQGYELILNLINKDIIESNYISDLYEYIKFKLKDFKETNFNIIKEALNIFIAICQKGIMPKAHLTNLIMSYSEKISDIKLKDNLVELINMSIKTNGPEFIIKELIKKLLKKNNPKVLIEYSNLFGQILIENKANISNKELIEYSKYMANNNNPQVRSASTNLICILYKIYGQNIKSSIKDIKESTLKIIEAELDKIELSPEQNSNLNETNTNKESIINDVEKEEINKEKMIGINPQDISKKITKELLKDIEEGKWTEKKEAVEKIEKIINDANMKILPNGLNDLFDVIKCKLTDCNKNLVKILISLLSKLIQSLKQSFKSWTKNIALGLIPNLADKSLVIRKECLQCFDKWVENTGIETLVIYFPQFLKIENIESRIEIMKFIEKYNNIINKNIGENLYKELADPLLLCLQDKTNNVRTKAEDIIKLSFKYIPVDIYYKKIKDFKPAIADVLKQIMNKIEGKNCSDESKKIEIINDKKIISDNNHKNTIKNKINNSNKKNENIKSKINNNIAKNSKDNIKKNIKIKKDNDNNLKESKDLQQNINGNEKNNINNNNKNKDKNKIKMKTEIKEKNDKINTKGKNEEDNINNEKEEEGEDKNLENENIVSEDDDENEDESYKEYNKKIKKQKSKSFNSEKFSDSKSNLVKDDDDDEGKKDSENEENNKKKEKNIKEKEIIKKENKKSKNIVMNEENIKVNILKKGINNNKEKNKNNDKIRINNNINNSDKKKFDNRNDEISNNNTNKIKQKNKNIIRGKTRNNKLKENINNKNVDKKEKFNNNKSISLAKFNSEKRRIISKSSAKRINAGKSKQIIDIISKRQLLFQDEDIKGNNKNDLDNNNTQRMSVNLRNNRNNKKDLRKAKSVEKKNIKKTVLQKYSKIFLMNNRITLNKNKRYELDKKYNFNISSMTKDDHNKIKEMSEKLFTEEFLKKILNQDFLKVIEGLNEMKQSLDKNENIQVYFDNFDIILKIISLKAYNNFNPALAKALCDFFESLYNVITEHEYYMSDMEINIIFTLLMEKSTINNIEIKSHINFLMKLYVGLFDINKIIMQLLNMSLLSNNKIKANILEFILDLNENQNLNICNKKFIRIFSLFLHCNDNEVKNLLFELFRNIYNSIGEKLWNLNDVIAPKEMKYLQNNIFKNYKIKNKGNNDAEEDEDNHNDNENDDNNIEDNYEESNQEVQNDDNYEENEYKEKIYSKNNLNNNYNNKINIYNNDFINKKNEKYESDYINNRYEKNNNFNLEETPNNNNADNYNDTFLKFNDSSYNTLESNNFEIGNSYNMSEISKSQIPNKNKGDGSKKLNMIQNSKITKNISTTKKGQKKIYDNNINNYKNSAFNLLESKSDLNNQSGEKSHEMQSHNEILSPSPSSEKITSEKELLNIMNNLSSEDESEKLNTIVIVHEILCTKYEQNKYILIPYIDNIILIFIKITHDIFDVENIENISVKFAKYLVTILCKIASNKELITHITYKVLHDLTYELLKYLLITNLDKIGENQEGSIIFKSLNSAMLRILENCDTTSVILVLLEIIKKNQIKEDDYNISNLAIKCLIKMKQNLKEYINSIHLDKIFLQMHLILINYDKYINDVEIKTQTDIMTVKFIKNFIIDVVKIKKQSVLHDYNISVKSHKIKDNHIFNWIKNTLLMIKNIESNKQIINENISKGSIDNKYNTQDLDNENENNDKNQSPSNHSENKSDSNQNEENKNLINNKKNNRMIRVSSKKLNNNKGNNLLENKNNNKDDYLSILNRIKILKQNLKENNHINSNNNTVIKRKKSIEINKKIKNKK